jgi:hypothetical protein
VITQSSLASGRSAASTRPAAVPTVCTGFWLLTRHWDGTTPVAQLVIGAPPMEYARLHITLIASALILFEELRGRRSCLIRNQDKLF